jgi:hypothetical protein
MNPRETIRSPAPYSGRAPLVWLWVGVIAAPAFWFAQEWLGYAFSSYACFPGDAPLDRAPAGWGWVRIGIYAFDGAAIIAAMLAGYMSWQFWLATRDEKPGGAAAALELGEGRTRFIALWGIMYSLAFLGVIIFETIASIMVPLCGRAT